MPAAAAAVATAVVAYRPTQRSLCSACPNRIYTFPLYELLTHWHWQRSGTSPRRRGIYSMRIYILICVSLVTWLCECESLWYMYISYVYICTLLYADGTNTQIVAVDVCYCSGELFFPKHCFIFQKFIYFLFKFVWCGVVTVVGWFFVSLSIIRINLPMLDAQEQEPFHTLLHSPTNHTKTHRITRAHTYSTINTQFWPKICSSRAMVWAVRRRRKNTHTLN